MKHVIGENWSRTYFVQFYSVEDSVMNQLPMYVPKQIDDESRDPDESDEVKEFSESSSSSEYETGNSHDGHTEHEIVESSSSETQNLMHQVIPFGCICFSM